MSVDENKALVHRFYDELLNQANLAAAEELVTADYVWHRPAGPDIHGLEAMKQHVRTALTALPDFHCIIEDMIAEGDKVATRFIAGGTHKGEFMGLPPTGNEVVVSGIGIERVTDRKIAETWERYDTLGWAQQLGLIPTPGSPAPAAIGGSAVGHGSSTHTDTHPAPARESKALVHRYYEELFNRRNLAVTDECVAPDWIYHRPSGPDMHGLEEWNHYLVRLFEAFPDYRITVDDILAEGNQVVVRFTASVTHANEFMGIPASGKHARVWGIGIHRIASGKIVEQWVRNDTLGFMQQLGVIPTPGGDGQ